jgi:hypothetical protein
MNKITPRNQVKAISQSASTLSLVIAIFVGQQLGGIPWRYRKQIWQLQGLAIGFVAGFILGRISSSDKKLDSDDQLMKARCKLNTAIFSTLL